MYAINFHLGKNRTAFDIFSPGIIYSLSRMIQYSIGKFEVLGANLR